MFIAGDAVPEDAVVGVDAAEGLVLADRVELLVLDLAAEPAVLLPAFTFSVKAGAATEEGVAAVVVLAFPTPPVRGSFLILLFAFAGVSFLAEVLVFPDSAESTCFAEDLLDFEAAPVLVLGVGESVLLAASGALVTVDFKDFFFGVVFLAGGEFVGD